jgi:2',3'-cyclic-nucleotide 2'-phosphodiesterase (5'-nucleotidase family)
VNKLLDIFALEGGQGISGVRMEIKDGKAANVLIQGKPIENDKLYSIATNDFLAGGNDRMIPLATPVKRVDTGLKIRNLIMEYVIRETQEGRKIQSKLDGRIR